MRMGAGADSSIMIASSPQRDVYKAHGTDAYRIIDILFPSNRKVFFRYVPRGNDRHAGDRGPPAPAQTSPPPQGGIVRATTGACGADQGGCPGRPGQERVGTAGRLNPLQRRAPAGQTLPPHCPSPGRMNTTWPTSAISG